MLLRLIPESPLPTILFTLAFGNLPDGMPFPAAWTAQLQHILHDELELPQCIHALDKAAWAACLLHEVTFSVAARKMSVVFVDGTSAEWPLESEAMSRALKEVMDDVSESSVASEMEQRRAQAIQAAAQAQAAQERMPAAPNPSPPKGKHKKSRSLLMSLVASFCPSSHPPPALLPLPLAAPPPLAPLELVPPPPEPPQSSRFLRRKARAGLVDIYRRYVLSTLSRESPFSFNGGGMEAGGAGGYVLWNLQSILKRIEVRMRELGVELGSTYSSSSSTKSSNSRQKRLRSSPPVSSESPFDEEGEETSSATGTAEGSSESADTEASSVSVHTPRDVLPAYTVMCTTPGQEHDNARVEKEGGIVIPAAPLASTSALTRQAPRSRPPSRRPCKRQSQPAATQPPSKQHQDQQHEYAILHASTVRLRALIARTSAFTHAQAEDRNAALVLLERKSRRRAWSTRQLMGGAQIGMGLKEGLAVPLKGSGLRWSWTLGIDSQTISDQLQPQSPKRLIGLGVPRVAGGRVSARREFEAQVPMQLELPVPKFCVPSQTGCVPFPRVDVEGDDFCSTGPQDTSQLFGGGEEGDGGESTISEQIPSKEGMGSIAGCSHSSDDLPSLLSSLSSSPSTSPSPSDLIFDPSAYEDAEVEELEFARSPMLSFHESDTFDPPYDAFTPPLSFEEGSGFSRKLNAGMEAGMGLKMHAQRRVALLRYPRPPLFNSQVQQVQSIKEKRSKHSKSPTLIKYRLYCHFRKPNIVSFSYPN